MTEQEIFLQVVECPAGPQREACLQRLCGDDVNVRARVESLVEAHERTSDFLAAPAFDVPTGDMPPILEGPGSSVGPYRLLQRIGEGGFGVVYMAEQTEPVRRKVALKIIRPGMDTREVIARFESERQALALMDHPNIARVLDAGATESGRPYFVMELVKGVPITEFCDRNHLSVDERMELFVPVCLAVQHAHHKGVIHRDIKPSNVMVTLHDGKPVPKVIDFGVAKATSQQLTQKTLFTAYGQMIGTPVYMSPEQAEMSGLDIDTRSDIYSLGVLLYELLTGTTPLDLKRLREVGLVEMQRLIREVEAPKPSTRLSTLDEKASIISGNRGTDARRLCDQLRGDIDWIVMKSLEKDRQRRYDTPAAFADDITRFLNHDAIHARPPSTIYRLRKFIRRNRGLAAGVAAVLVTLLGGAIVSTGLAIHANQQWTRAQRAENSLQSSLDDAQQARQTAEDQREEAENLNTRLIVSSEEQRRAIYAAEMNLVRIEAQRGNLKRMREILLDQLPIDGREDLRGFEWNYWYRYLNQAQVLMKLDNFQYGKPDSAAAIVPGGRLLAVTKGTSTRLIDLDTKQVVTTYPIQLKLLVDRTRFANNGRAIVGAQHSGRAFWRNASETTLGTECTVHDPNGTSVTLPYPTGSFAHVSFLNVSPDGRRAVALGVDPMYIKEAPACRLLVWDIDSQKLLLNQVQPRELNRVEFSPDGSMLVAYLCHGSLRHTDQIREVAVAIDVASGQELGIARHDDEIDGVFWLPDQKGMLLVTLSYSGASYKQLLSWTISQDRPIVLNHETMPDYVKGAVSPDGRLFAVTGHTVPSIRLFDTQRGKLVDTLHSEAATIDTLTFTRDGQRLIACTTAGEVVSWDLSQQADLFALRSRPIKKLAINGFDLSDDQSLLALATADGEIAVRTRGGEETILRSAIPNAERGISLLRLSPDSRYLAHVSNVGPDGKLLSSTESGAKRTGLKQAGCLVELYDLTAKRRRWSTLEPIGMLSSDSIRFSPDSAKLVFFYRTDLIVMDCRSGEARLPLAPDGSTVWMPSRLQSSPASGGLMIAGLRVRMDFAKTMGSGELFLSDATTGKPLAKTNHLDLASIPSNALTSVVMPIPSPDGVHIAVVRLASRATEIWNVPLGRLVLQAPGNNVRFSDVGDKVAFEETESYQQAGQSGTLTRIARIRMFQLPAGQKLGEIAFDGNGPEESRFSPDGKRLLTLHGLRAMGSGGSDAQGRLWDVSSGREILSIPVADVNKYVWDLAFDSSGYQLTSLLLQSSAGTGGNGTARVFDARPLSEQDDAQLIANRLIEVIAATTPVPDEVIAEIEKRTGLAPLVRKVAFERARQMSLDVDRLAGSVIEHVYTTDRSNEDFQRALKWAEVLNEHEPNAPRSRVLLAAANYRVGRVERALELASDPLESSEKEPSDFEMVRRAVEILAISKLRGAPQAAGKARSLQSQSQTWKTNLEFDIKSPRRIVMEALFTQPLRELMAWNGGPTPGATQENTPSHELVFQEKDVNHDGAITEGEAPSSNAWYQLISFDANQNEKIELHEFTSMVNLSIRFALVFNQGKAQNNAEYLQSLDTFIQESPSYYHALNARAWLLATCPEDSIRNGTEAVKDARKACELTRWKVAQAIDTLAAAHAEAGDFDEAIRVQLRALSLTNSGSSTALQERLAGFRMKQPVRDSRLVANRTVRDVPLTRSYTAPLLGPDIVIAARQISGWSSGWSPDGKFLLRNESRQDDGNGSPLSIVEIETGETKVLVPGGVDPSWSPLPGGPIAFTRAPEGQKRNYGNEEVWVVNPDGSNLRRVGGGGFPTWTNDGRLVYRERIADGSVRLATLSIEPTDDDLGDNSRETVPTQTGYPAVSRDGTMIAESLTGKLVIRKRDSTEPVCTITLQADELGLADFSPDGRYLAYGSWSDKYPGLLLIEIATGRSRVLAGVAGTLPRWSPDGRFISVDVRSQNKILILDVSTLDLAQCFEDAP